MSKFLPTNYEIPKPVQKTEEQQVEYLISKAKYGNWAWFKLKNEYGIDDDFDPHFDIDPGDLLDYKLSG